MCPSPRQNSRLPKDLDSPSEQLASLGIKSPTSSPPSTPTGPTKHHNNQSVPTPPIPIPRSSTKTPCKPSLPLRHPLPHLPPSLPSSQLHPNTITPGRPPTSTQTTTPFSSATRRNTRNLAITTTTPGTHRHNPLLSARGGLPFSPGSSPSKSRAGSKMTTPAESPTTPNQRMIFEMEFRSGGGNGGARGGAGVGAGGKHADKRWDGGSKEGGGGRGGDGDGK